MKYWVVAMFLELKRIGVTTMCSSFIETLPSELAYKVLDEKIFLSNTYSSLKSQEITYCEEFLILSWICFFIVSARKLIIFTDVKYL